MTTREEQRDVVEQPYCAVTHAVHLKAVADRMHGELLQQVNGLMNDGDHSELSRIAELVADYEEVRWDIEKTRPLDEILNAVERVSELEAEITRLRASQAGGVPEGWALIPIEPDENFFEAAAYEYCRSQGADPEQMTYTTSGGIQEPYGPAWVHCLGDVKDAHRAMLSASPPPPATDGALESEGLVQANVQGNGSVTLPVCQWQPIETAPMDGTGFYYYQRIDDSRFITGAGHFDGYDFRAIDFFSKGDEPVISPTHWTPLPPRPDDRTNASEAQSDSLNHALPASSVSATDAVEAERRLREALAPLAAFATFMDKDAPDEAYLPATVPHISLTLGQARAAATLLGFPHASDDPQFTSSDTEHGVDGADRDGDDESVFAGVKEQDSRLTFGVIRRARALLSASPPPPATDGDALREALEPILALPDACVNSLTQQRQIDMDGSEVGVSRQAVDEIHDALTKTRNALASSPPQAAADAVEAERAIRADEREKCATLAEDDDGHFTHWGMDRNTAVAQETARAIASAIRARGTDEVENG